MPSFSVINGVRIAWSLTGPEGAPVALLANGLAADTTMWAPQVDEFSQAYRVLCYDMRGHGDSETTPGDYSLGLLADDIMALLADLGIDSAHFVGCSLGAMVGQYLGAHDPSRLRSLTLCATSSNGRKEAWETRVTAVRDHGVPPQVEATIDRWFTPDFRRAHPDVMDDMREMVLRTTQDGYAGCAAAIRDMTLSSVIGGIRIPTLVIAGELDLSTPLDMVKRIADAIPGAEFLCVADAAHMPTIEQPDVCNAAITAFLRSVDSKPVVTKPTAIALDRQ
ncbi:3-oxoadipate enol-lactonase [Rhizobium sp. BK376]|uniref:3-oxoadipate enol-lactonase n=1 Tax=Rhizobium sp. BK376 TaxID=2512149 RepID=UPI00104D0BA9|nr:3-oxoadipate enol-lactonase [Rhizobium sp. BK376]TCR71028.1 3-oxoadipate enol-lactonase [Rhizobium sp. BK376]